MRFNEFAHLVDIDAFEEAIGFEPLEQVGDEDRGYCPLPWDLHTNGDTTGKFSLNREKRVYGCWVCGGGSLLSLAMAMKDMEETEAIEWMHQFVGGQQETDLLENVQKIFEGRAKEPDVMPYYNDRVLTKWLNPDHDWVKKRGISHSIASLYKIGYEEKMIRHAPKVKGEQVAHPYEGPAIILPHFWRGKLVGWQNRWLDTDLPSWLQKYTNNPDFPKRTTLFNYDAAKLNPQKPIVVESVPTALFLLSEGYSAMATFGSKITENQMIWLRGFQQGILFAPDNDGAGEQSLAKLKTYLDPYIPLHLVLPPEGKNADLGDLVNDREQLVNLIENPHGI